jgi:hypothetical protein
MLPLPKRAMAHSVYIPGLALPRPNVLAATRHSVVVRFTHWINALTFIGLVVSGMGILVAHPRFYWGETGRPRCSIALRFASAVPIRWTIRLGPLSALSVGLAVRLEWDALRNLQLR